MYTMFSQWMCKLLVKSRSLLVNRILPKRPHRGHSFCWWIRLTFSNSELCAALTGGVASFPKGDQENLWVSWMGPAFDQSRLTQFDSFEVNTLCGTRWSSSCFLSATYFPSFMKQTVQSFPLLSNSGIPERLLCVVGPWRKQCTVLKHVERHIVESAKPHFGHAWHWNREAIMDFVFVFVCCYCWGRSYFAGKRIKPPQISWRINVAGYFWPCFYTLNSNMED